MNHPSTQEGNWRWRLKEGEISEELAEWIRRITQVTERSPVRSGED